MLVCEQGGRNSSVLESLEKGGREFNMVCLVQIYYTFHLCLSVLFVSSIIIQLLCSIVLFGTCAIVKMLSAAQPKGRAIQVEGGIYGERVPSTDIRRPRLLDPDVVIHVCQLDAVLLLFLHF